MQVRTGPVPTPAALLDLVALGTVADLVPLDANNRVLVAQGLRRIRAGRCVPGIRALLEVGGRNVATITAADLGFAAGPRLNAAGRLDDMSIGIRCLLADSPAEALALAARLDELNKERRAIETRMQDQAIAAVRGIKDVAVAGSRRGVCLYDPGWHQGVVGLVASRIKDRIRRPVIAFADAGEGLLRGSARSVAGRARARRARCDRDARARDAREVRRPCDGRGHDARVGRPRPVRARLRCRGGALAGGGSLADRIETDGELAIDEICLETANAVREGGPWGQSFPEPTFDGRFAIRKTRVVGEKHLKMWVEVEGARRTFDAIAFNYFQGRDAGAAVPAGAQLVYRLDVNEYQGERRLQLLVDHVLP